MAALVISGIAIWKYGLHNEFFDAAREGIIYIPHLLHLLKSRVDRTANVCRQKRDSKERSFKGF